MARRGWLALYLLPAIAIAAGLATSQERPREGESFRLETYHFDIDRAWRMLEKLVALGPRYDAEPREAARKLILEDAQGWGATTVGLEPFDRGRPGANVIAEYEPEVERVLEGASVVPLRRRIVVLGHFDTVPGAPGALDNATSIALLAGLGPALAKRGLSGVILGAVDEEERGLVGSRALAEALGQRARVAISTEMVGWRDGRPVLHTFPTAFGSRAPELWPPGGGLAPRWLASLALEVGRDNDRPIAFGDPIVFPVYHLLFRHFETPFESDAGAFAERGVPALFLSDCSFTRFYPQYHQPTDAIDRVDRASLERGGRALEALVVALSEWQPSGTGQFETSYFTFGSRVVPGWALILATVLATLPLVARAGRTPGWPPALVAALVLATATALESALAPVTAFVVVFPAWLLAPLVLAEGRLARAGAALLVLLPALLVAAVIAGAIAFFGRGVAPQNAVAALVAAPAIALGLALIALAPRKPA